MGSWGSTDVKEGDSRFDHGIWRPVMKLPSSIASYLTCELLREHGSCSLNKDKVVCDGALGFLYLCGRHFSLYNSATKE
jgi:hypothetical protein